MAPASAEKTHPSAFATMTMAVEQGHGWWYAEATLKDKNARRHCHSQHHSFHPQYQKVYHGSESDR
jgi:hypothetical protein